MVPFELVIAHLQSFLASAWQHFSDATFTLSSLTDFSWWAFNLCACKIYFDGGTSRSVKYSRICSWLFYLISYFTCYQWWSAQVYPFFPWISPFSFLPEFVRSIQFCHAIATQFLSKANLEVAVLYYSLLSSSSPFSSISLTGGLRPRTALGEKCCTTGIAVSGCSSSQRAMSIISTVP